MRVQSLISACISSSVLSLSKSIFELLSSEDVMGDVFEIKAIGIEYKVEKVFIQYYNVNGLVHILLQHYAV